MVYFLIPVYNESLNIQALSLNIINAIPDLNKYYLFVDDNSTDDTIDLINKHFAGENFHIINKEQNLGPGDSFNKGFEWILGKSNNESEIVITMEADNTSAVEILYQMVKISNLDFELVLASVYAQGGGFEKTNIFRKVISFFANMTFRSFFNIKVNTLSSFYRIYKISLLKRIKNKFGTLITEAGFICKMEILLKAIRCNASIIEVPMILKSSNRKGKSKMKVLKTSFQYLKFLFTINLNPHN
jgi:dolichol-phosphate mannosyltransferase